jgi:hypothetical protein
MNRRPFSRRLVWIALPLLAGVLIVGLGACGPVSDVIGDRKPPTPTHQPFFTATPGGRLVVWLITPTGQFDVPQTPGTPPPQTAIGNPVGPNATATADIATRIAATALAAAPPPAPYYQPNECPAPGAPSPPSRPPGFSDYKGEIGRYLSAGGSSTVLEATLRNWGAITDRGGVVQADTDLTGDGVLEIIVTMFNPETYNPDAILNAGQLVVYGCDGGGYRVLYDTPFNPGIALPELLRVGDMNTDVRNELVFSSQTCSGASCFKEAKILTWDSVIGVFEELNNGQIIAINGRFGIADIDSDGVLELTAQINPPAVTSAGPPRSVLDTWDWTGREYVLALREQEPPHYRIHAIYDADDKLRAGEFRAALDAYARLRDNRKLAAWTIAGETEALRAYAAFRIVIIYARLKNGRANDWLNTLVGENPPGTPGGGFAQMGQAFMDNFRTTNDARAACAQAINAGAAQMNVLGVLNSFGSANRTYTLNDVCPF